MTDARLVEAYVEVMNAPSGNAPAALAETYVEVMANLIAPPPDPPAASGQPATRGSYSRIRSRSRSRT